MTEKYVRKIPPPAPQPSGIAPEKSRRGTIYLSSQTGGSIFQLAAGYSPSNSRIPEVKAERERETGHFLIGAKFVRSESAGRALQWPIQPASGSVLPIQSRP
jgi:hypothetical protein